jgi:hypothetical protein
MGRAIVTRAEAAAGRRARAGSGAEAVAGAEAPAAAGAPEGPVVDGYLDRLVKYVPADVIAFYLAVQAGVANLPDGQKPFGAWVVFLAFLAGTWLWLRKAGVKHRTQLLLSVAAFAVWVFATGGGPLAGTPEGRALAAAWGPIVVPTFTFAVALVEPGA